MCRWVPASIMPTRLNHSLYELNRRPVWSVSLSTRLRRSVRSRSAHAAIVCARPHTLERTPSSATPMFELNRDARSGAQRNVTQKVAIDTNPLTSGPRLFGRTRLRQSVRSRSAHAAIVCARPHTSERTPSSATPIFELYCDARLGARRKHHSKSSDRYKSVNFRPGA